MARRIHIPAIVDVVIVDDPEEMKELNRNPDVSRVISGEGGLLHRVIHRRIYGTLRVGAEPLPVFAGREAEPRIVRQETLEKTLTQYDVGATPVAGDVHRLARYVATGATDLPVGVTVQQMVGRLFRPDYMATRQTYEAARVINEWPRANPVKALWWRTSGKLRRSRTIVWDRAGTDPVFIHATAIAFHNIVAAVERLRTAATDTGASVRSAADVVRACLVAPTTLLRSATNPVRVPSLRRPLRRGTLLVFKLGAMHARSHDEGLAFAGGEWNQCPGHDVVPRLLEAVWTQAMSLPRRTR